MPAWKRATPGGEGLVSAGGAARSSTRRGNGVWRVGCNSRGFRKCGCAQRVQSPLSAERQSCWPALPPRALALAGVCAGTLDPGSVLIGTECQEPGWAYVRWRTWGEVLQPLKGCGSPCPPSAVQPHSWSRCALSGWRGLQSLCGCPLGARCRTAAVSVPLEWAGTRAWPWHVEARAAYLVAVVVPTNPGSFGPPFRLCHMAPA
jgi:hypothetical protein